MTGLTTEGVSTLCKQYLITVKLFCVRWEVHSGNCYRDLTCARSRKSWDIIS